VIAAYLGVEQDEMVEPLPPGPGTQLAHQGDAR
jgi:hypothetical protein